MGIDIEEAIGQANFRMNIEEAAQGMTPAERGLFLRGCLFAFEYLTRKVLIRLPRKEGLKCRK